ncbi:hypothetical protein PIB30_039446 [Stylosanthes scabra]|uniref:Uncharacterized protein n=1 Tax=Stylosanthes scabra TaxID=79078 RepID=A0ABU6UDK0_9FABA|nr:hypothetical protein [Stylosanthes scabra]
MPNYEIWVQHGEGNDSDLTRFGLGGYNASNDDSGMNSWDDNVLRYESMVADAFPQFDPIEEDGEREEHHDPNPDAIRFYQLLESVRKPLWEVSGLVRDIAADASGILKNYYEAKKLTSQLGLNAVKIDSCVKGCIASPSFSTTTDASAEIHLFLWPSCVSFLQAWSIFAPRCS